MGRAEADLDLVEERGVADRDASLGARRAHDLEERADADAVEAAADLALLAEARFDPAARAERLADTRDDRAGVALLADVAGRTGAELAHALEEVLLPGEEDHGRVAQRDVATERAAEREAVEVRHQDVADDEVGRALVGKLERLLAVEGLVDDAAGRLEEVGEEPHDAGIVVGDDDAAALEADLGGVAALRRAAAIAARDVGLVEQRRWGERALGAAGEAHRAVAA